MLDVDARVFELPLREFVDAPSFVIDLLVDPDVHSSLQHVRQTVFDLFRG